MSFANMLQNLMKERQISAYKLSKMTGCSQSTIKYWIDGKTIPQKRTIESLAEVLGVTPAYLKGEEDEYGLNKTDWEAIGLAYQGYRLMTGKTLDYVSEHSGIPVDQILAFEDGKTTIAPKTLMVMCGLLNGATMTDVFHGLANAFEQKKAPAKDGGREPITDDGYHIGVLYDRADEKDRMLTHSVLDKYEDDANVISLASASNNPGGFVEFDVYDEPAAAGFGNYLDAPKHHREQFPAFMIPKGTDFGIRISGNSMEPVIKNGMTVFVKQAITIDNGKVGIFLLNGEAFCKQLVVDRQKKEVRLHSFNQDYADIIVKPEDNLLTIGQVL